MPKRALATHNTKEPPRKKCKPIPLHERKFTVIDGKPDWMHTNSGERKTTDLANNLNKNANKLGIKESIFVVNKETNSIEVRQVDYEAWQAALATGKENKPRRKPIAPRDRVFTTMDDRSEWMCTEVDEQKVRDVARILNQNAEQLGFETIFFVNRDTNCVEVRQADYNLWKTELAAYEKNKQPRKPIALKDRTFTPINGKPEWMSTHTGEQKAKVVANTLNNKAKDLSFGKAIFVVNGNCVEIRREDYEIWREKLTIPKKRKQLSNVSTENKQLKNISAKNRIFTTMDDRPGWMSTEAGEQNTTNVTLALNTNAKNLGFKAIFIANKDTNCVEVLQADHAEWEAKLYASENKQPRKPIAPKDRVFTIIDDRPGWLSTEAGKQKPTIVERTLNANAKNLGFKAIFVANKDTNCVEVLQADHAEWEAKLYASEKNKQRIKQTATKDRIFTPIDGKPGWMSTDAGGQKAIFLAGNLNRKAKKLGLGKTIFIANSDTNCVEVAGVDYRLWLER